MNMVERLRDRLRSRRPPNHRMELFTRLGPGSRQQRLWRMVNVDWSTACMPYSDFNGEDHHENS